MIHRPGIPRKREKGQPEGSAIKSKTRKPRVANTDRKTCYAAGRNNSNPTPFGASASDDEWELLLVNSSHYCFIQWLMARSLLRPASCGAKQSFPIIPNLSYLYLLNV